MDKFLNKKYKLIRNRNYEELLTEIGMNSFMRKVAKNLHSTTQLVQKSPELYVINTTVFKILAESIEFTPNVEFEEKTTDGRKVKSTIVFDGNKMIHTQHGEKPLVIERRFFEDEMIAITTYGNVVCTSWSKLVK